MKNTNKSILGELAKQDVAAHFMQRANSYNAGASWVTSEVLLNAMVFPVAAYPAPRTLDLGAGTGAVAQHIAAVSPKSLVYALDRSLGMLTKISTPRIQRLTADSHDLPFPSDCFDVVLSRQAFHYFKRPLQVLSECRRVLSPKGLLVLAQITPFGEGDKDWWKIIIRLKQPLREHRWTQESLLRVLSANGFKVIKSAQMTSEESLQSWLSRYEHTDSQRASIKTLYRRAPENYAALHKFRVVGDDILFISFWSVLVAQVE